MGRGGIHDGPMRRIARHAYLATIARYHYLPSALIALALSLIAASLTESVRSNRGAPTAVALVFILGLLLSIDRWTALRVEAGRNAGFRRDIAQVDEWLRAAVHSVPRGSELYIHNGRFIPAGAMATLGIPIDRFPISPAITRSLSETRCTPSGVCAS